MGSILISMPKVDDSKRIAATIRNSGLPIDIEICSSGAEVLRTIYDRDYGVVICTKKMRDMECVELVDYLPKSFGMIVLTGDKTLETISDKMIKLIIPFTKHELISSIEMITNDFYYAFRKKKKVPPKRSAEEQKVIDDAKAMLMERNGMSEPEAFRYIQKNSMDYSRSMVEAAQMLLMLNSE